ncbi:MAG: hypothetical protein JNL88_12045 [Bacteroidia bacterium]|nr:hypothetical protein [Bacteroidia bacterium]
MKPLYTLAFIFILTAPLAAQNSLDVGLAAGTTNYFGDLGNDEFFQKSSMSPGMAITVRNFISPREITGMKYAPFNIEARLSWHRIQYDETEPVNGKAGGELRNYGRGLNFRNDIFGFSSHFSYTYYPNRRLPLHKQGMAFFVYTGVGIYYGRPKADLFLGSVDIRNRYYFWNDGTVRDAAQSGGSGHVIEKDGEYETDLIDWRTEGQGAYDESKASRKMYSPWHIGVPLAAGFRYGLNKNITLSMEFGYYKFFTDYLDDASEAYATYKQIEQHFAGDPVKQELAKYISDPTGLGTDGMVGPRTSRRGNPDVSDSYSFINLEIAYKINWNPKKLTVLFAKKGL